MTLDEAIKHLEESLADPGHDWGCEECKGEHEQLLEWLRELKELREENKVLISECDRLIKEKGELLKKSEQIAEYKRLLKAALEDLSCGGENNKCTKSCNTCTHSHKKGYGCRYFGDYHWRYANEALALMGGADK